MCGIFAVFLNKKYTGISKFNSTNRKLREVCYRQSSKQRHRGPDHTGIVEVKEDGVCIVQERLAVLCPDTGDQPLKSNDEQIILSANGEIYNYIELSSMISKQQHKHYVPKSDCEVIIPLYEHFGEDLVHHITGMYTFVLYDRRNKNVLIARDHIGIIPLYYGRDDAGNLWIASEMKCLVDVCTSVEIFPPGSYMFGDPMTEIKPKVYYNPQWIKEVPTKLVDLPKLRESLIAAVRSHLQCDVEFGALLSGGVDSSLIASIATKIMRENKPNFRLKTFSVGLENAPDFKYSQMVANHINSDHTEVHFTVEEGLDCIRDIIYHLESYDITTIRASIPMYILSRHIKSKGLKMILSGEGADEIFGGYLYFYNAPSKEEFHKELVSRVLCLSLSDCLRANKSTMSWGLELRVPFLDKAFINHSMSIRPEDKMPGQKYLNGIDIDSHLINTKLDGQRIEKHILRKCFTTDDYDYLPTDVLWRQKEQFSDGVGYSWIDTLRSYAASQVNNDEYYKRNELYPINTPATKEAFYYRKIFNELYPSESYAKTVMKWIPRLDWGCSEDPSGRAQAVHTAAYQ